MANRFYIPLAEAQDASGGVAAGYKLKFTETGTTTNLDTFSDDALTTANANPVVADSAGRWGTIFLKDQGYRVVLSTDADVQIWSEDNVRGSNDNLIDDTIKSTLSTTGSSNAYALTVNRVITAYANGDTFVAKANFQNTGAATLNITGGQSGASALGAKTFKKNHDQDVVSGDIENGQWFTAKYDGTNMQLISPTAASQYTDPITTRGDLIRGDSSGNVERLGLGTINQVVQSDGTDLLWGAIPLATDTVVGGAETATQAEQETGTATDKMVTSGRQNFHPSAVKMWASVDRSAGTPSLSSPSYNVTSVTDDGAGNTIVTIATDFSSAIYSVGAAGIGDGSNARVANPHTIVAGAFDIQMRSISNATVDADDFTCWAFGDL